MGKNIVLTLLCLLPGMTWATSDAVGRIRQSLAGLYKGAKLVANLPVKGVKIGLAYPDYAASMVVPSIVTYQVLAPSKTSIREFTQMVGGDDEYAQVQADFGRKIARCISLGVGLTCGAIYHGLRVMGNNT